jgi:hypothetical protein
MSAISSAPAAKSVHDAAEHSPADAPDRSPTPTLITEADGVFSSAAAGAALTADTDHRTFDRRDPHRCCRCAWDVSHVIGASPPDAAALPTTV